MKKIKWLALSIISLCFILGFDSCKKDDEPATSSIVGTWLLSLEENDGGYWYCEYKFSANGKFAVKDWSSNSKEPSDWESYGNWSINGNQLTLDWGDGDIETFRFSLEGKILIIYDYEDAGPNVFVRQ